MHYIKPNNYGGCCFLHGKVGKPSIKTAETVLQTDTQATQDIDLCMSIFTRIVQDFTL